MGWQILGFENTRGEGREWSRRPITRHPVLSTRLKEIETARETRSDGPTKARTEVRTRHLLPDVAT
jgi:hypothetical protein